jgi:hypothetical protein
VRYRPGLKRLWLGCHQAAMVAAGHSNRRRTTMSLPAHRIRCGVLQVTIWRNHGERGPWYSVVPTRSYKNGDDTWKETESLGFDDLLTMAKLFDQAHTWIMHQQQADAKARKESERAAA